MLEISFYHLTRRPLDSALPTLVEMSLKRGWRVAIQAASQRRLSEIDDLLWSYRPESFLPHGTRDDGAPEGQPVYLTLDDDNPNAADVRFFVEGARAAPLLADPAAAPKARVVLMFDEAEREGAREQWRELSALEADLVYWQEDDSGKFVEKARKKA